MSLQRIIVCLLMLCIPSLLHAACNITKSSDLFFSLSSFTATGDKSLQYLGIVLGQVGTVLFGEGNDLLGRVFAVLNTAMLTLASLTLSYSAIVGVMSTANEGEAMGRKWSSAWIPARSVLGIGLLIPSTSGYSMIQVLIVSLIVQGIGAGNAVWQAVLNNTIKGISVQSTSMDMAGTTNSVMAMFADDDATQTLMEGMFKGMVCKNLINLGREDFADLSDSLAKTPEDKPKIEAIRKSITTKYPNDIDFYVDNGRFYIGDANYSANAQICGSGTIISGGPQSTQIRATALSQMAGLFDTAAREVAESCYLERKTFPDGNCRNLWSKKGLFQIAKMKYLAQIDTADEADKSTLVVTTKDPDQVYCNAMVDGWLFAGSYYYQIVAPKNASKTKIPPAPDTFITPIETIADQSTQKLTTPEEQMFGPLDTLYNQSESCNYIGTNEGCVSATKRYGTSESYINWSNEGASGSNTMSVLKLEPTGSYPKQLQKAMAALSKGSKAWGESLQRSLTQKSFDPMYSMQRLGNDVLIGIELTLISTIIATFLMGLLLFLGHGTSSIGHGFMSGMIFLLPFATALISILWVGAATLAIYLPLVPYIVFTFAALAWLIVCLEAVVAGPVIAYGFMSPSGDHFGKATPAINIMANIVLRPALMIVGFIAAARLFATVIGMLNYGFLASVSSATPGLGIFGPVALLIFYAGICITITHKCFALIYIIPDKALHWIGGHAEQSGVSQDTGAIGDHADKGMKSGAQAAEGLGNVATKGAKAHQDKRKEVGNAYNQKKKSEEADKAIDKSLGGADNKGGN